MSKVLEKLEDIRNVLHTLAENPPVIQLPSVADCSERTGYYHVHPVWELKIREDYKVSLAAPQTLHDISGHHIIVGAAFAPNALRIGPYMIDMSQNKYSAVLQSLFEVYNKTPDGLDDFRKSLSRSIFILLDFLLMQVHNVPKVTKNRSFFERAMFFINQNYWNCDLSISNVAEFAGCSTQYLNRIFKEKNQKSLKETLMQVRMERAYKLLGSGEHFVSEVAGMTGFRTQFYFSNVFRRYYGISPVAIRDRQQQIVFET